MLRVDFDFLVKVVEQSLTDDFPTTIRCLIFCLNFVQIFLPGIRLMSNKKDRNFYENGQFLPPWIRLFRRLLNLNPLKFSEGRYIISQLKPLSGHVISRRSWLNDGVQDPDHLPEWRASK